MEELRKIADSMIPMLKTEADSPDRHPELGYKVPILDIAVWVEEERLPAPGLEDQNLHTKSECLLVGDPRCDKVLEAILVLRLGSLLANIENTFSFKKKLAAH